MRKLLLLLLLGGCAATSANYNAGLQRWMGQSELALYQEWGQPENVFYLTPDKKVVTFVSVDNKLTSGDVDPYTGEVYYPAIETENYGYPSGGTYNEYYCRTSFTITNGSVTNYTFNGDNCVSRKR